MWPYKDNREKHTIHICSANILCNYSRKMLGNMPYSVLLLDKRINIGCIWNVILYRNDGINLWWMCRFNSF